MQYIGYIYLTTNLVNGKQYVGQHQSKEYDPRYKGSGEILKQAFKKYGWNNFKCEVLCWCKTIKELNYREHCEIVFHSTFAPNGYNVNYGGRGRVLRKDTCERISNTLLGRKFTNERKQNISNGLKGNTPWNKGKRGIYTEKSIKKMSDRKINHPTLSKKVFQYTKDWKFVAEYPSISEVSRLFGYNGGHISECCAGKRKTSDGFRWTTERVVTPL